MPKLRCPECDCPNTRVIDSRSSQDQKVVRRRRLCTDCGTRFTTFEILTENLSYIRKEIRRFAKLSIENLDKILPRILEIPNGGEKESIYSEQEHS